MGWLAILFTIGVIMLCLVWYLKYARKRVNRDGAIGHVFQRLGERQDEGLDQEFRGILKERDFVRKIHSMRLWRGLII